MTGYPDLIEQDVDFEMPEPELVQGEPMRVSASPMFETGRLIREDASLVQHAPRKPVQPSRQARAEAQPALRFDDSTSDYETPPLSLLSSPEGITRHQLSDEALEENARMLENVLDDYGVKGEIVSVRPGPVVTMYELEPAPGLKASRVIGLSDDIARSMSALSARVSTVPGRSVIGIELPNEKREKVVLREILSARDYGDGNQRLPLALGKDIAGDPVVANLAKMPHLLIAGTTGSGKSVAINTMILSLLYKLTPAECRLIMIDPKMLELSVYDGIPHLLSPVVTDPKKAVVALKWTVGEMEERYRKMSKMGVRNIEGYNGRVRDALEKGELFSRTVQTGFDDDTGEPVFETEEFAPELLPYIVVIVDEMADLMMVAGQGDRGLHPAPCADGPRLGHPPHHGHAASVGRCDHRHDQGELPDPDLVPGHIEDRQPHDPGRNGRRAASGHGRHALHGGRIQDHPRPRPVRVRRGGRGDRQPPQVLRCAGIRGQRAGRPRR